ncbi:unknown [Clostridium sp. CAG:242]|nr:unknown [Clostridium sp. CAG:242]
MAVIWSFKGIQRKLGIIAVQYLFDCCNGFFPNQLFWFVHCCKSCQRFFGADILNPRHHTVCFQLTLQSRITDYQSDRRLVYNTRISCIDRSLIHQFTVDEYILYRCTRIGVVHRACKLTCTAMITHKENQIKAVVHCRHHVLWTRTSADQPNSGILFTEQIIGKVFTAAMRICNHNVCDFRVAFALCNAVQHPLYLLVHCLAETLSFLGFILPVGNSRQTFHINRNIKFHILPFLSEFKIIDFIDQSSCYHFNTDFNQIKEDFF